MDNQLSNRMRNIVRNYNRRRARLIKAGYSHIPDKILVSDLKAVYTNPVKLNKELERIENLSRKDLVKRIETKGGVKAVNWEYRYIKDNANQAINYFRKEYKRIEKRVGEYPGERTYLNNIEAKIDILQNSVDYMNESQFKRALRYIDEFKRYPSKRRTEYRGFLSEVDWLFEKLGYSDKDRNKFFNKFSKLTPSQFLYAYDNNPLIARIYSLYHKDYGEDDAYITDEENAEELAELLLDTVDEIVNNAKANMA